MTEQGTPRLEVYKSINKLQEELSKQGITKGRQNQQQGYSFRGIDDVYNVLSPMLAKHKLCILPRIKNRQMVEKATRNGGALFYVTVDAEYDIVSSIDGSTHSISSVGEAMDTSDKATNKAMSAAYKYAMFQAFAIPTEGENDADSVTHEAVAEKPEQSKEDEYSIKSEDDAKLQVDYMIASAKSFCKTEENLKNHWRANIKAIDAIEAYPNEYKRLKDSFTELAQQFKNSVVSKEDTQTEQ